jgi:hypothetical protein
VIDRLIKIGKYYGIAMNVEISKVMRISRQPFPIQFMIHKKQLESVKEYSTT